MYSELLAAVDRRLQLFFQSGDSRVVLDTAGLREAHELLGIALPLTRLASTATDRRSGIVALRSIGLLHYARSLCLPADEGTADEVASVCLLLPVFETDPELVPELLHPILARLIPPSNPADALDLAIIASELLARAIAVSMPWAVDAAREILAARVDLRSVPPLHPVHGSWHSNIGLAYLLVYSRNGKRVDIDAAAHSLTHAVKATAEDHPGRAGRMANLALALQYRHALGGDSADLEMAIDFGRSALPDLPDDAARSATLVVVGKALWDRHMATTGDGPDIDDALDALRAAVAATAPGHPDLDWRRKVLRDVAFSAANVRYDRYIASGGLAHLDGAISAASTAVTAVPPDGEPATRDLNILGLFHRYRYLATGNEDDLNMAIVLLTRAVDTAPPDHQDRGSYLSNLGGAYRFRYLLTGNETDLETAIERELSAVEAVAVHHPDRSAILSDLGNAYHNRYQRTGLLADLDSVLDYYGQALEVTEPDAPGRWATLSNLGNAYRDRYEQTGRLADLKTALEMHRRVIDATPLGHANRGNRLSNLGATYMACHQEGGQRADLDAAIAHYREALKAIPSGHVERGLSLSVLGAALLERDEDVADLDSAVDALTQAVAATPSSDPRRVGAASNLGNALKRRYHRDGKLEDLDDAIDVYRQAIESAPALPFAHSALVYNLANAYRSRHKRTVNAADLASAVEMFRTVANDLLALPVTRVRAWRSAAELLRAGGDLSAAAIAYREAVARMATEVAPPDLDWADQERLLGKHFALVGEAVAAQLDVGEPTAAVEVAELGRGILLSYVLDSRGDLSELRRRAPELASELQRVSAELAIPLELPAAVDADTAIRLERAFADRRRHAAAREAALVAEIRSRTGLEWFRRPPQICELADRAAIGGPVVLINTAASRCDAIVLRSGTDLKTIPLPALTTVDVRDQLVALLTATLDGENGLAARFRRRRIVSGLLSWLWRTTAEPVLTYLGLTTPPPGPAALPRIWWVPTGLLAGLPLHAAGEAGGPSVLDFAISSYAPTVRALAATRAASPPAELRRLVVAMQHTPELPGRRDAVSDLPGTTAEADEIAARGGVEKPLRDAKATVDAVVTRLASATWAHFACHALADPAAPSRSRLLLYDGDLDVPRISRLRLEQADLAYLSACATASGGIAQADEVITVATACQLAGFRHVVGTLWPVDDAIAAQVAHNFYATLPAGATADAAATALHAATVQMRGKYPHDVHLWSQLVHIGP